ncbi:hypothetical protein ALC53_00861 [Atta colombica]|uniref:Uncharacterized protein n=1 Tax=Atta colombica TaxID=520822 RepID=A0A195BWS0_9HYME|nr:hypothetical protein ALC53_00861 [Atta colombica]
MTYGPSQAELNRIAPKGRASSSTDSSSSSPSDLRRRLEDLPSPNEFTFLADRVAALSRRICRKREIFLRLHEVANRIEENDEWEEREQRAETESSLRISRPKDARARRRATVHLESSLRRDDKAMVISQTDDSTNPSADDKLNPTESSVERSAQDDRLRLPMISRRKSRPSSLSEPSSSRFSPHRNDESRDIERKTLSHSYRNFTPREIASKSTDLRSVSPFSLSCSARPKKFGGYRPPSGVILKNLSSSSESEFVNETSCELSSIRKIDNTVTPLELSSPESMVVSSVNEPVKKMPIMSARSDITGSILPNLLPSSRSLDNDNFDRRIAQNTSQSYAEQINRDEMKTYNQPGKINTLVDFVFNERASHDGFVAKTSSDFLQAEPEYEGPRYQRQETPQDTSIFFTKNFMLDFAKPVSSAYNEQVTHNEPTMKVYDEFKRIGSEFESIEEKEEVEDYQHITSKIQHDIKNSFEFNCSPDQFNFEVHSLENNGGVLDMNMVEWHRSSLYSKEAVNTSHFIERIQNDVTEEALSSQTSELYGSEDHSRSSCTAKMYLQKETLSSRRLQTGIDTPDKCDQEILTKVPTLALNSQDISYSTSAGSRECSATQPLDPHALIKALSDVSLKQEKQADSASRKREGFYHDKDTIDASSGASDFPTKGETWRVPGSSTLEPRRSLSRIPSRIPIRISSNKSLLGNDSRYYKPENSNETAIYGESKFIEQNSVPCESIIYQMNSSYSEICKQNSLKSRNESIEVTVTEDFAPDEAEYDINNRALNFASSNLRSPQNTFFGDYAYDKMQHLSAESKFKESCSPTFFHKATVYSSDRDYAKIDDDVRSRSDRSTSRKSVDTVDVTSVTESPSLSKFKKDDFRIESFRNAEENVTWRTEDECASINDEENLENVKDYTSRGKISEGLYLQDNEQYKLAIGRMCEPLSFKNQYLQLNSLLEIQKSGRKRNHVGDNLEFNDDKLSFDRNLEASKNATLKNLTFHVRKKSNFAAKISPSTLNLNCEPKRKKKKKSQERFPFTISETSKALSIEHDTNDYQSPDKNLGCTKTMDYHLREKTDYQLKMHPSLTRLASAGMEDTMADILCCVAEEKKQSTTFSKSMMRAFVRIFSSKKAPKQPNDKTLESTKIIYENNACQENSKANSCSDNSSTKEVYKTRSNDRWVDHHTARSNPILVSSWETLKKTETFQVIAQKYPHRRFDRDDLWVQDIKDSSFDEKKDSEILQRKDETGGSGESSAKDRYSIFLAKNLRQSNEPSASNHNSPKKQQDMISDYVVSNKKSKRSTDRKVPPNLIFEIEEDLTGCFCWRLCHIFAPSKYRSPVKAQVLASRTKKSDSLLQKRKK